MQLYVYVLTNFHPQPKILVGTDICPILLLRKLRYKRFYNLLKVTQIGSAETRILTQAVLLMTILHCLLNNYIMFSNNFKIMYNKNFFHLYSFEEGFFNFNVVFPPPY